jgi:hypothetical protein
MTQNKSAGDAMFDDPINTQVKCKICGLVLTGAAQLFDHIDLHEGE